LDFIEKLVQRLRSVRAVTEITFGRRIVNCAILPTASIAFAGAENGYSKSTLTPLKVGAETFQTDFRKIGIPFVGLKSNKRTVRFSRLSICRLTHLRLHCSMKIKLKSRAVPAAMAISQFLPGAVGLIARVQDAQIR